MSVYPAFLQPLKKFGTKTMRNTTDAVIDFVSFIVKKYGNDCPSRNRLVKPESTKAGGLLSYRSTFGRSEKEKQKTQSWIDFRNMPSVEQFKEAKEKTFDSVEKLQEVRKERRNHFSPTLPTHEGSHSPHRLQNACRVSSAIYIQHQHYKRLIRNNVDEVYSMPLSPPTLN